MLLPQCRVRQHPRLPARYVASFTLPRTHTDAPTPTATAFLHICALLMVIIMILHIRSKYTAVGRKEILIFFYCYFLVELVAIFLDSSIIPSSSPVYQVRSPFFLSPRLPLPEDPSLTLLLLAVVRCHPHWLDLCDVLVLVGQRIRRFPGCRGRNTSLALGTPLSSLPSSKHSHRSSTVPARFLCGRRYRRRSHRHRHLQEQRGSLLLLPHRTLHPRVHLQPRLRRHLHHRPTHPRHSHPRRPVAHRRHHLRNGVLDHRAGSPVCVQQHDLRCCVALHRRDVLPRSLHAAFGHDGFVSSPFSLLPHSQC